MTGAECGADNKRCDKSWAARGAESPVRVGRGGRGGLNIIRVDFEWTLTLEISGH